MVVITFFIGVVLALPLRDSSFLDLVLTSLGLCLIVAGANIWNCWMERDVDAYMLRTKKRPLVTGKLKAYEAFLGALSFSVLGLCWIYFHSNPLTFYLGLGALFSYVLLYTPLKRRSTLSLFVGAFPGALPPAMGWTAVQGDFSTTASLLFWILFLWQLPHFISIAIYRREEYEAAGLKTLPTQIGIAPAKWHMLLYSALLVFVSFLPYFLDLAGSLYIGASILMGTSFLWFCWESLMDVREELSARKVFFASLAYLPLTIGVWALEALLRSLAA
jgi:protoheme IX farnesyltransferase